MRDRAVLRATPSTLCSHATLKRVVVDVSEVKYVDSTGIAALVEALKLGRKNQIEFALTGVHGNLKEALQLTRLDTVFEIKKESV